MPSRFPKIEKLWARLKSFGFDYAYDFANYQIGFSRPSGIPSVFEHLHVCGQGKYSEVLYAKTYVSAIKHFNEDECVTIRDLDLMYRLERDKDRHWTEIRTPADKVDWQNRLIEAADDACRQTARKLGAELLGLISQQRDVADRFISLAGDLTAVLDREFAYLNETPHERQQQIKVWSWAHNDNQVLACHLFFRLVTDIDGHLLENCDCKLRDNDPLRRLMHMISDHVADCRDRFIAKNR